jgi:DNA polymerase-3 subunit delta
MPARTPAAVRRQIAGGELDPVYLLLGTDETEQAGLVRAFADSIDPDLRAFNVERFHGGETTVAAVLDALRTFPLGGGRRLVLLVEAEKLVEPRRESEASRNAVAPLVRYLGEPEAYATLVISAMALNPARTFTRTAVRTATVVECRLPESRDEARRWVKARMAEAGKQAAAGAVDLLVDRIGAETGRLRGEVDRLLLYVAGRPQIEKADVIDVMGGAASEGDWEMTNAIERGDAAKALRELALTLDAGAVPYMVLGKLAWYVRSRHPAGRVAAAVEALFRADLDLKSSAADPRILLERLVVELCGPAARP